MKQNTVNDLTVGSPMRLILGFAVPLIGGLLFQQLYNMTDTMIVGQFLGIDALAGVGSTTPISFFVLGFSIGTCNGLAIPISQRFGNHDLSGMRRYAANGGWLGAGLAVVITLTVCLLCDTILELMHTPAEILPYARNYIFTVFLGIPAVILYNYLAAVIRAVGDSKTPLFFLVISSVLNVILDLITVAVLHLGVVGPAAATVISQTVSGLLCLFVISRKYPVLAFQPGEARPDLSYMLRQLAIGIPMGLQNSVTAIGNIIVQTATNDLGSVFVAASAAGMKVRQLLDCSFDALGTTMIVFAGQNFGAGQLDRIRQGLRAGIRIAWSYSLICITGVFFFGGSLVSLFIDASEPPAVQAEILRLSMQYLLTNCSFYGFLSLIYLTRFLIQGLGYTRQAVFAGVFELTARSLVGVYLVPAIGFTGVCFANPSAWVMADVFLLPAYFIIMRRLSRRFSATTLPAGH